MADPWVGMSVGTVVRILVGCDVFNAKLGAGEGAPLGVLVGCTLGKRVGTWLGTIEGLTLGELVLFVGEADDVGVIPLVG